MAQEKITLLSSNSLDGLSAQELRNRLDMSRLPGHIAVIMDGNRRWASARHLPAIMGHRAGVKAFRTVMETCRNLGIKTLTAYAFSAENWRRAPTEVSVLMQLFEYYGRAEREEMMRTGIRFRTVGRTESLPESVRTEFAKTAEATKDNRELTLNLAVNYGGREELVDAVRALGKQVAAGELKPEDIDEEMVARALYTGGQDDPDLLIRTSGELRVSNFLLWQIAYAEFWFSDIFWPDVDEAVIYRAILDYQGRDRRFGGNS